MIVKRPVDEDIENTLTTLHDNFLELKSAVSEVRKSGKDTSILDLKLYEIEPLIKMARVTYEVRDIDRVKSALDGIRRELDIVEHGDPFTRIHSLIEQAYAFLREGKKQDAARSYAEITTIYRELSKDLQKTVFRACLDLHKKVS